MASQSLGYMVVEGAEGQVRGASLVVDLRGIPLDFRYTDPIRPTRLERVLYGSALDTYLKEELILQSLLGAAEVKPQLWACADADLLLPLKNLSKTKSVLLSPSSRAPMEAAGQVEATSDPSSFLLQADSVSAPLRMTFPSGVRPDEVQQTAELLTEAARTMELLEPFSRIQKAFLSLEEG